jgi:hypothetical protein
MATTYDKIATTTLGSAGTITFSSIAASWTDLRIIFVGTSPAGQQVTLTFNGDTATNYSKTDLTGDGATASSTRGTSQANIRGGYGLSSTIPTMQIIDIFSYAGSTNKTVLLTTAMDQNGSGQAQALVGLWRSTAAITSVGLGGNFNANTTATIYGILKA